MNRPPPISTLFPYTTLFRSLYLYHATKARRPQLQAAARVLAILGPILLTVGGVAGQIYLATKSIWPATPDRKSTRLNSSHMSISYAVFCLTKKKRINTKYAT